MMDCLVVDEIYDNYHEKGRRDTMTRGFFLAVCRLLAVTFHRLQLSVVKTGSPGLHKASIFSSRCFESSSFRSSLFLHSSASFADQVDRFPVLPAEASDFLRGNNCLSVSIFIESAFSQSRDVLAKLFSNSYRPIKKGGRLWARFYCFFSRSSLGVSSPS